MTEAPERSISGRLRRWSGSVWLRSCVTLALLGFVAAQIDWNRMLERLRGGHPLDGLVAVGLVALALVIGVGRWQLLLRGADIKLDGRRLWRVYAVSTFSNTFLPTTVGGDVTRALLVARRGTALTRVAVTIVVDRVGGLFGLLGIAWLGLAIEPHTVPRDAVSSLAVATGAVLVGVLLCGNALIRGGGRLRRMLPARLLIIAAESRVIVREYLRAPRVILLLVVSSIAFQALIALQLVMLAHAIGVGLPFSTAAVTLALVTMVTLLPVSIGGFGVREGSYVVLLGGASVAATDATLISVLSVAALFIASLPGAYFLAHDGLSPVTETVAST